VDIEREQLTLEYNWKVWGTLFSVLNLPNKISAISQTYNPSHLSVFDENNRSTETAIERSFLHLGWSEQIWTVMKRFLLGS